MALTDAQIKTVVPKPGKRYSKADTGGLLLGITPGGVRSWIFRCRINGKQEKVVIGRYPDVNLKKRESRTRQAGSQGTGGKISIPRAKGHKLRTLGRSNRQRIW